MPQSQHFHLELHQEFPFVCSRILWWHWGLSLIFPISSLFFNIFRSATQIFHACFDQSAHYCTAIGNRSFFRQRWSCQSEGLLIQTQATAIAVEVLCRVTQSGKLLIDDQFKKAATSSVPMLNHRISYNFCLGSVLYVSWVYIQSSMLYALNSSQLMNPNSDDIWRKRLREWKANAYMQNSSRKVQLLLSSFFF